MRTSCIEGQHKSLTLSKRDLGFRIQKFAVLFLDCQKNREGSASQDCQDMISKAVHFRGSRCFQAFNAQVEQSNIKIRSSWLRKSMVKVLIIRHQQGVCASPALNKIVNTQDLDSKHTSLRCPEHDEKHTSRILICKLWACDVGAVDNSVQEQGWATLSSSKLTQALVINTQDTTSD